MHSVAMEDPERMKALLDVLDEHEDMIAIRADQLVVFSGNCVVRACAWLMGHTADHDQKDVRMFRAMHKYLYTEVASPNERQQIDAGVVSGGDRA